MAISLAIYNFIMGVLMGFKQLRAHMGFLKCGIPSHHATGVIE